MTTPRISTYATVTNDGALNPFTDVPHVTSYGNTADDYHTYMLAYHYNLPVYNDYTRMHAQILRCFMAHRAEWEAMQECRPWADTNLALNNSYHLTDTTTHSGEDTATTSSTATDAENTYDNATMRDVRETTSGGSGSTTYGHEIETDREKWAAGDPLAAMEKIIDISYKNGIFGRIIDNVVSMISCKVYTPDALFSGDEQ